jgi:hypothetical protein
MRIPRETQVLGKYMPWYNLVHHTSHMTWPGMEPGSPQWGAGCYCCHYYYYYY